MIFRNTVLMLSVNFDIFYFNTENEEQLSNCKEEKTKFKKCVETLTQRGKVTRQLTFTVY